ALHFPDHTVSGQDIDGGGEGRSRLDVRGGVDLRSLERAAAELDLLRRTGGRTLRCGGERGSRGATASLRSGWRLNGRGVAGGQLDVARAAGRRREGVTTLVTRQSYRLREGIAGQELRGRSGLALVAPIDREWLCGVGLLRD